jgi:secreted protein with Ig-like and vWFA domain
VELDTAANEFIFVLDRSGSMDGVRIRQAKVALLIFLKSLPPGSYFNVVSFGSGYTQLFETS